MSLKLCRFLKNILTASSAMSNGYNRIIEIELSRRDIFTVAITLVYSCSERITSYIMSLKSGNDILPCVVRHPEVPSFRNILTRLFSMQRLCTLTQNAVAGFSEKPQQWRNMFDASVKFILNILQWCGMSFYTYRRAELQNTPPFPLTHSSDCAGSCIFLLCLKLALTADCAQCKP